MTYFFGSILLKDFEIEKITGEAGESRENRFLRLVTTENNPFADRVLFCRSDWNRRNEPVVQLCKASSPHVFVRWIFHLRHQADRRVCTIVPKGSVRFWSLRKAPPYGEIHLPPPCCLEDNTFWTDSTTWAQGNVRPRKQQVLVGRCLNRCFSLFSGKVQCLVQLSTFPVAVCYGCGATSKDAQAAAAHSTLEYLKILTKA